MKTKTYIQDFLSYYISCSEFLQRNKNNVILNASCNSAVRLHGCNPSVWPPSLFWSLPLKIFGILRDLSSLLILNYSSGVLSPVHLLYCCPLHTCSFQRGYGQQFPFCKDETLCLHRDGECNTGLCSFSLRDQNSKNFITICVIPLGEQF